MKYKRVAVFGANGKIGSRVVAELLSRGYEVTAFIHGSNLQIRDKNLQTVEGDIYDATQVAAAVQGVDAVVSALGSWGTPKKDILSKGMPHIIAGMKQHGITRVVSLTGADARAHGDRLSLIHRLTHLMLAALAGKVLRDGELHIQALEQSDLDWTVVRSPVMKNGNADRYALNDIRPMPWVRIERELVVRSMLDELEAEQWLQKAPYLH
jgi:putative NADH-flavin reductase